MKNNEMYKNQLAKLITQLGQVHSSWRVWSDFIHVFAISISNLYDKSNEEARASLYENILNAYSEDEQLSFIEMASITTTTLTEDPNQDFLGDVYMMLNLNNHWTGQFFTPFCVSMLMAQITFSRESIISAINNYGYATINDCACGAGSTLIAGISEAREHVKDWRRKIIVSAQDIDQVVALMCYIQLSIIGCAGFVKVGNTITDPMKENDDQSKYWYTPTFFKRKQSKVLISSCNTINVGV